MDDRDEEPVVIYHSHTATEAYPSRTDISYANEPGAHYVLVSTRDPRAAGVPLVPHLAAARSPRSRLPWWNDPGPARVATQGTTQGIQGALFMAIEVRIPTILRTYTDGAKQVEGTGSTLDELLADLDRQHGGLRDRLVDDGGLRRFVNVYLNDEDVRFLAGLETPVKDGDTVTVLPAVAGGAS